MEKRWDLFRFSISVVHYPLAVHLITNKEQKKFKHSRPKLKPQSLKRQGLTVLGVLFCSHYLKNRKSLKLNPQSVIHRYNTWHNEFLNHPRRKQQKMKIKYNRSSSNLSILGIDLQKYFSNSRLCYSSF